MEIVDLSMPIETHFRWPVDLAIKGDVAAGDQFRVSRVAMTCHGFSHVDAQAHFVGHAPTIETTPLNRVVGPCRVLDLSDVAPEQPIDAERLAAADPGGPDGEILLLACQWDRKRDYKTREFWLDAPYLTRDAALWLKSRNPTALAFDFPQDYPIRLLLDNKHVPSEEHLPAGGHHADRIRRQHGGVEGPADLSLRRSAEVAQCGWFARPHLRDRRTGLSVAVARRAHRPAARSLRARGEI
jgi:kynurenine formamidase